MTKKKDETKKEETPEYIGPTDFGKLVGGVSRYTVRHAIKTGRLTCFVIENGRYKIHAKEGVKEWETNTDKKAQAKAHAREAKKKIVKAEKDGKLETKAAKNKKGFIDNPQGARTYNGLTTADAERQEKFYKAELAKLKFQEQAGQLMETEKVKKAAFEVGRKIRDNMMSIAAKHAHELAAETDPHTLEVLLTKKINEALGETITVDFEKLKRS